ncbi:hypothetical protein LG047_08555 [Methylocystis sp. WRRC1]|uniref:hypothetical protein n=1 Tax=unclassified Methylocystis TaxID=2625913 RepID=UPI0011854897|nr:MULTISPECIES: hypothetical protein [unclassified Methylocystis]MCC3245374.1 hypothetical protein [Methylocystis sp. WRRC1]
MRFEGFEQKAFFVRAAVRREAPSNKGACGAPFARASRDAGPLTLAAPTSLSLRSDCERLRAALRVMKRFCTMMRPDHIYFAMTMVKHGTLAGAFIFAFKILKFAIVTM